MIVMKLLSALRLWDIRPNTLYQRHADGFLCRRFGCR